MPALDFRAFAAGFATQAQKIEEESAKIGMDLLKKAMEDFREEAKDYKGKYDEEIRNKKDIARVLRGMLGDDDAKVKAVLDRGDLEAKKFINSAEAAAAEQGLSNIADLVPLAEGQEAITGFDVIDYIDSGVYVREKAPVYMAPESKTGVFNREIGADLQKGVETTKSAYIPERKKYEGDVPMGGGAIDLRSKPIKGVFEDLSRTDVAGARKMIKDQLSIAAGLKATTYIDDYGETQIKYVANSQQQEEAINKDVDTALALWTNIYKDKNKAVDWQDLAPVARDFAATKPDFYTNVQQATSQAVSGGGSRTAGTQPAPATPAPSGGATPAPSSNQTASFDQQTFVNDPSVANLINPPMGSSVSARSRRTNISAIAQSKYGLSKAVADQLAAALVP